MSWPHPLDEVALKVCWVRYDASEDAFDVRCQFVLDDFVRMRLYRKQAAEFQWLADNASVPSVQRRYRVIARHHSELADRDEQADKTKMARRLEQLRLKRQEAAAPGGKRCSGDSHRLHR